MSAPLILFGFNRPEVHARSLANLARCHDLRGADGERAAYVFLDGSRGPQDVSKVEGERAVLERFRREHFPKLQIIARPRNFGNVDNMVGGITEVLDRHGRAIVIEDDILVSRTFLRYMDESLDFYRDDPRIWCINANPYSLMKVPRGYRHDVYLHPRNMCWGWGTWKDRWEKVDFEMTDWPRHRDDRDFIARMDALDRNLKSMIDEQYAGQLHAWDVQCTYHIFKYGLYAVEPRYAMSKNIGTGVEGVHCTTGDPTIATQRYFNFQPRLEHVDPDPRVLRNLGRCGSDPRLVVRILRRLRYEWLRFAPLHDEPIDIRGN